MYFKRDIEDKIIEAGKDFPSITIYGSRQVGKSTMIENIFPDFKYITLDDIQIKDYALKDPKGFLKYYGKKLIIDEIQKSGALFEYLKIEIDNYKKECLKDNKPAQLIYILSGSNQFELHNQITESLAGRTCLFELSSLSYNEIKKRSNHSFFEPNIDTLKDKEKYLNNNYRSRKEIFEDIYLGGMPEYIINKLNREMFFKSYVQTYIEKDVRKIIKADKETTFMNFMKYIALRTACQIDYNDISSNIGIDSRTIKSWLSILETSGIIRLLHPYASNLSNRIIKTPKLYFMDTGLCSYLAMMPSSEILEHSAFSLNYYETYVVSEIIKSYQNNYKSIDNIYYYRDKDKHVVDLIIEDYDSIYPIEIKKGINPVSYNKNFKFLNKFNKKVNTGLVIDSSDKITPINDDVYYAPIDMIGI